jgi:hypothetical protein
MEPSFQPTSRKRLTAPLPAKKTNKEYYNKEEKGVLKMHVQKYV